MNIKVHASRALRTLMITTLTFFAFSGTSYATALSSSDGIHVDGFSLPGIRPAGYPNLENDVTFTWKKNRTGASIHAFSGSSEILFNYTPTESYLLQSGSFQLKANFDSFGNFTDGDLKVTGVLKDPTFTLAGVQVTADLESFNFIDNLLGFNTTNLVCPDFDFCTTSESVYLLLNDPGFNTSLKSFRSTGLAVTTLPLPGAGWMFGAGLLGLVGVARRRS